MDTVRMTLESLNTYFNVEFRLLPRWLITHKIPPKLAYLEGDIG